VKFYCIEVQTVERVYVPGDSEHGAMLRYLNCGHAKACKDYDAVIKERTVLSPTTSLAGE
jgi:hypothetical protein